MQFLPENKANYHSRTGVDKLAKTKFFLLLLSLNKSNTIIIVTSPQEIIKIYLCFSKRLNNHIFR